MKINKLLFPYQIEGIQKALNILKNWNGVLIADEMGLGKTFTAINLMDNIINDPQSSILIVSPAAVKYNWKVEIEQYSLLDANEYKIIIIESGKTVIKKDKNKINIIICNYDLLFRPNVYKQLREIIFNLIIADESHYLKSVDTKRSKAFRCLKATKKILLSGTPMANRPIDLYGVLSALLSKKELVTLLGQYSTYQEYGKRYAGGRLITAPFARPFWDFTGASNLKELAMILHNSIMIRRTKKEVLTQLPDKTFNKVYLGEENKINSVKALANINVNDIMLMPVVGTLAETRHQLGLLKIKNSVQYIQEILEATDEKIVIFAYHTEVLEGLSKGLSKYKHVVYTGNTKSKDRQELVEQFQTDKDTRLFIGQIVAAGTGITLTASSHIIFVETSWGLTDFSQAVDRCHRIGQKENVLITLLTLKNSIDALVLKSLVKKTKVVTKVIDNV